jgi:hypothetical protein
VGAAAGAAEAGIANATATPAATVAATPVESIREGLRRRELGVSFSNTEPELPPWFVLKFAAAESEAVVSCLFS